MSDTTNFRPLRTGNPAIDEAFRIAFDYIYQLKSGTVTSTPAPSPAPLSGGGSVTIIGGGGGGGVTTPQVMSGSFEARPPVTTENTLWIETSRSGISNSGPLPTYIFHGGLWTFVSGSFNRSQAQLAVLALTLGVNDLGAIVYVGSPFCHRLQWIGTGWTWADPGDASGRFAHWRVAPPDGWQLADGSVVQVLNSDGTTSVVTVDNSVAVPFFLKSGTYTGAVVAAVAPTTAAVSAGTPSGTVSQPTFTGIAMGNHTHTAPMYVNAGSVWWGNPFGNGTNITPVGFLTTVADATVGAGALVEAASAGTPFGTVSQPTFTGAALGTHTHTISLPGDPVAKLAAPLYYRV